MAGAHLRGGRRGPARLLVVVTILALLVGLAVGGGATLLILAGDDDTPVDAGLGPETKGSQDSAVAVPASEGADDDPGPITIAFAGDINVERDLMTRLENDPTDFVGLFAEALRAADLAIGNLEAALVTGGSALDKEFTFRAPPSVLDALAAGGFDVISAANNHSMDFGVDGLAETLQIKRSRPDGLVIGIGENEDEAYEPYIAEVGGHTVAVIAATQVIDAEFIGDWTATQDQGGVASAKRVDRLVEEVEAARVEADTVIVYLHWGIETETCPSDGQQGLAQDLVDAGADLVVGGHAHRLQGGGRLGPAFVGYGLGNFLFGAVSEASAESGVLLVEVDGREILGYEWRPGRIEERVPIPLEADEAEAAVVEWNTLRECTNLTD